MHQNTFCSLWLYPRGLCSQCPHVWKFLTMYHSQPTDFFALTSKRYVPLCVCVCVCVCVWARQKIISTPLSLLLFHVSFTTLSPSMYTLCFLHIYLHPISSLHSGPFLSTLSEFPFFSSFDPKVPHASTAAVDTYTSLIYITSNSLPFPGDSYISYRRLYFLP